MRTASDGSAPTISRSRPEGPAWEKPGGRGGTLAGAVRLKAVSVPGTAGGSLVLETGIWLRRSLRGRGIGREALRLVTVQAAATGAAVLTADTATVNAAARSLLAGFATPADDGTSGHGLIPPRETQTQLTGSRGRCEH